VDSAEHHASRLSFLGRLPKRVEVYEVGPRDGLQNELRTVPTKDKLRLLAALVAAGEKRIEATSFVSPKWIPQLADADDVVQALGHRPDVHFSALVPNLKGLERAKGAGLEEAAVFLSASESHSRRNLNKSIAEALETSREVAEAAKHYQMRVRAYISVVWGCPFEGKVSVDAVVDLCRQLNDMGVYQISLGDTIGTGTPTQTAQIVEQVLQVLNPPSLALHLHDTRGTALANALVGISMGVTTLDASIGGLGGCPYAPGAAGNLASEDLVYMLHGMGIETGIDLSKLVEASEIAQQVVGRKLPSKYLQAALGERERASRRAGAATSTPADSTH
jgi:hydroxymethylglutaryl-CoA lyase